MPSLAGLALLLLYLLLILWPLAGVLRLQRQPLFASAYSIAALACLGVILVLGLARLPLLPALVLLAWWEILAGRTMVGDLPPEPSRARRRVAGLLVLPLLVVAIAIPTWLLPRVPPIELSGPFPVGVLDLVETDSSSVNNPTPTPAISIRVWYPAELEPNLSRANPHLAPRELEEELAAALPGWARPWMFRSVTRARVEAWQEPRLSTRQRSYPVVILSAGIPGFPAPLAGLAAELASEGFVVVAPEPADIGMVAAAIHGWATADSGGMFRGRLRIGQIGWIEQGVSAAVLERLAADGVIGAVVMLDPPPTGFGRLAGVPVLTVAADPAPGTRPCEPGPTCVLIPGAGPADLTDLARWSPFLLRRAGLGGELNPSRMAALLREWTLGFLGHHLLGKPVDVLTGLPARYPEVRVGVR